MNIIIASANEGKIKEIKGFFKTLPVTFVSQTTFNMPSVEETGLSFIENALIKARHASRYGNLPALADDSGLVVNALQGAPGIFSARYAGEKASDHDNIQKLLAEMSPFPEGQRQAHFHCAIAFVRHAHDPAPIICQAQWEGVILEHPMGTGGFGYDPVFYLPTLHCTAAELNPEEKNRVSHRAKALSEFVKQFSLLNV